MTKQLSIALLSVTFLTACGTGGVSKESSRQPKGNPNAAVMVQEFADLQCPACASAHTKIVAPLLEKYGNQIRYDHKHFPLRSIHRYALEASMAAECAADQGKFWEFVDIAFTRQKDMNEDAFMAWADELGLESELFKRCYNSNAKRDTVLDDYKEGREMGVGGTPTFFVNGQRVDTGFDTISEAIDALLEEYTQRL